MIITLTEYGKAQVNLLKQIKSNFCKEKKGGFNLPAIKPEAKT